MTQFGVGAGSDVMNGGPGADRMYGDSRSLDLKQSQASGPLGKDKLIGGGGADFLDGERDRDTCRGKAGDDRLKNCERGRP
jgi:Ca2+-binding RTX toxin-like protein